ncbi:MAG: hypothetical protein ABS951_06790 [Solibacillus sp.]
MDNKEIALHLTVAAMNNKIIRINDKLTDDLVSEPIKDFYFDILDSLNTQLNEND